MAPNQQHAKAAALPAPLDLGVFRQMADMSNDAFYLCDQDGRFLYVNERSITVGGYSREDMLQMAVPDIAPEFPPGRFRDFVAAMAAGAAPTQFETLSRHKDGHIYPIEISVARIDVGDDLYLFGVVRDISERKQMETAQKTFTQRLLQTLEAERERVARELHDDVGQAIATVGVLLHNLERTHGSGSEVSVPALAATRDTIRQITESVARIVRDCHPAELTGLGFEDTVRAHAQQFAQRHGLTLRLATVPAPGLLSADHELHLYRIEQEALANVARHARATRVTVQLTHERGRVVLTVRDNGVGFALARAQNGLGLVTMRERAELMQAELVVRTAPRRGTEIRVAVALEGARSGRAVAGVETPPITTHPPGRSPRDARRSTRGRGRRPKLKVI